MGMKPIYFFVATAYLLATLYTVLHVAYATGDVTLQVRTNPNIEWSGAYGGTGGISSIDGQGNKDITLPGCDIYSANFQIKTDAPAQLTVNAVEDGKIINTQSTNAEFGIASVTGEC